MRCPKCGLENPCGFFSATPKENCECGYNFQKKLHESIPLEGKEQAMDTESSNKQAVQTIYENIPTGTNSDKEITQKLEVENNFKSGVNWFFWIAGLSLINSIVLFSGGKWAFIVGLGITQFIDSIVIGTEAGAVGTTIALMLDVFISGIVVTFGVLSRKKYTWAFIVGMVLYALDGLLFLIVQDWLSIGFHAFALFCLYRGLKASNQLKQMQKMQKDEKIGM